MEGNQIGNPQGPSYLSYLPRCTLALHRCTCAPVTADVNAKRHVVNCDVWPRSAFSSVIERVFQHLLMFPDR